MTKILEPHDLQRLDFTQLLCRKYGPSHYELSMNIRLAHKSEPETPETTY